MIDKVEKNYIDGVFKNYKLTRSDGSFWYVPEDEANRHYQEIQEWITDGGTVIDNGGGE